MITVFSFGAGQESMNLLHKLLHNQDFYNEVIGDNYLLVVGSDTGNEHDHTYLAVQYAKRLCHGRSNMEFHWVTSDMGFHPRTWQSLSYQYQLNDNIGSAAFRQTCTDNLKVKVVNNFVEAWLKTKYSYTGVKKQAYHQYCDDHGQIKLILGFASGEEKRTANGNKFDPAWKKRVMVRQFPLIDYFVTRQDCIDYNTKHIPIPIWPSNCMMCFYQSDQEILWLWRFRRSVFNKWVRLERAKLRKYAGHAKNYGVYGKITLLEKLAKAKEKYGHWSDDQLNDYKFSHGHCINSKY